MSQSLPNDPTTAIRDATRRIEPALIEIRRDIHAHPELGFEEVRTAGVVARELDPSRHQPPDRHRPHRRRRPDRGRPPRPGARHPRRHGRAADRGEVRPAVRQHQARPDACLRPRHPHHHAARRRRGAEGPGAAACRHGEAGVPAGRGGHRRHEGDDRRRRDGRPQDRSGARVPQSSGDAGRHLRLRARRVPRRVGPVRHRGAGQVRPRRLSAHDDRSAGRRRDAGGAAADRRFARGAPDASRGGDGGRDPGRHHLQHHPRHLPDQRHRPHAARRRRAISPKPRSSASPPACWKACASRARWTIAAACPRCATTIACWNPRSPRCATSSATWSASSSPVSAARISP